MLKMRCDVQVIKYFSFILLAILLNGCGTGQNYTKTYLPPIESEKIAFLGFKRALSSGQEPALFLNPLSGAAVRSEPVSLFSADKLSDKFFDMLTDTKECNIVDLRNVKNLTDPSLFKNNSNDPIKILQSVGKAVSADVVLTGYIYRMNKREGSEYSAQSPASVAFDVYLVSVKDGSFLWKGSFDKTQKSLSENLLEFKAFLDSKGKWVDAENLSEIGLNKLINEIPLKNK